MGLEEVLEIVRLPIYADAAAVALSPTLCLYNRSKVGCVILSLADHVNIRYSLPLCLHHAFLFLLLLVHLSHHSLYISSSTKFLHTNENDPRGFRIIVRKTKKTQTATHTPFFSSLPFHSSIPYLLSFDNFARALAVRRSIKIRGDYCSQHWHQHTGGTSRYVNR